MNASSGEIELDLAQISALGVDVVFWVAAALAYSEFLGDREVCLVMKLFRSVLTFSFVGLFGCGIGLNPGTLIEIDALSYADFLYLCIVITSTVLR